MLRYRSIGAGLVGCALHDLAELSYPQGKAQSSSIPMVVRWAYYSGGKKALHLCHNTLMVFRSAFANKLCLCTSQLELPLVRCCSCSLIMSLVCVNFKVLLDVILGFITPYTNTDSYEASQRKMHIVLQCIVVVLYNTYMTVIVIPHVLTARCRHQLGVYDIHVIAVT